MRPVLAGVIAGTLAAVGLVGAQPKPDFAKATELYKTAEAAVGEGRYADAIRDYTAAYEVTKDPVLFFKIGAAHQRGGRCDQAIDYYRRYLAEAKTADKFVALTESRILECGGDPKAARPAGSGSAAFAGSGSAGSGSADSGSAGSGLAVAAAGSGSAAPPPSSIHPHGSNTAWLLVGGGIAFAITGAVLAYSASSSENDVLDLYAGLGGIQPTYNDATAKRLQELIDEGHRYQHLSWASFAIAGGFAIGATIAFYRSSHEVQVAPVVTPQGAGVTAGFRF